MKNINIAKPFVGFYKKDESGVKAATKVITQKFIKLSFDEASETFWLQQGYIRKDGKIVEAAPKNMSSGNVIKRHMEKFHAEGYNKCEQPASWKIQSLEELKSGFKKATETEITIEEVEALPIATPQVEEVAGKTIKIANQVLPIRQGEYSGVPSKNENYFFDAHTNDVILDILENRRVLLVGHTGCGKTSLITEIASRTNNPVIRSNMNGQTTVGDFVGMWTVKAGETVWVDGVLPTAMKEGQWLIIDELDCADASILAVLNSVLEKNGVLTLKEKGHEVIVPHPDFRIFATANAVGAMACFRHLYQGTNQMNEAFLDRFRVYLVDYMPEKEEVKVLSKTVKKLDSRTAQKMVRLANMVRESFKKEEVQSTFSTRRLIDWAEMTIRHGDLRKAAQVVIFSKTNAQDAKVIEGLLSRI